MVAYTSIGQDPNVAKVFRCTGHPSGWGGRRKESGRAFFWISPSR